MTLYIYTYLHLHSIIYFHTYLNLHLIIYTSTNQMDSELYRAFMKDDIEVLKEIEGRLNVGDQLTATNNTVLHLACQYGSRKCVEEILSVHESLLLEINSRGETALHLAAKEGHYDVAVLLINIAAKSPVPRPSNIQNAILSTVEMPKNKIGSTDVQVSKPLTEESKQQTLIKQTTCTDQILCDQASVDVAGPSSPQKQVITNTESRLNSLMRSTDSDGETALHLAVRYNRKSVVQVLVETNPDLIYPQNNCHETPLYLASIRHYNDIISIILDNCKSPTFGGPEGRTALHAALMFERGIECVKLLLFKGNTNLVEVQDDHGWNAFHFVAYNDLHEIVQVLVDAEAKYAGKKSAAYKSDNKKRIAFHVAAGVGAFRVMDELLKYYPDCWEIVDGSGRNVLHIAVENNWMSVIRFILSQGSTIGSSLLSQRDHKGNTPLHLIAKLGRYVPQIVDEGKLDWKVDWKVTDYKNFTPLDVLLFRQETDTMEHVIQVRKIRSKLISTKVTNFSNAYVLRNILEDDLETGNSIKRRYKEINVELFNRYKEVVNTHMIVAALIATVALTVGFAVPGGFDQSKGHPQLLKKAAFKAFMITDVTTVVLSVASLLLYFVSTMGYEINFVRGAVQGAGVLNVFSIMTMMMTFGTGTYAVLAPSSALAIIICVLCSFLFPLCFFIRFFYYIHLRFNYLLYLLKLVIFSQVY